MPELDGPNCIAMNKTDIATDGWHPQTQQERGRRSPRAADRFGQPRILPPASAIRRYSNTSSRTPWPANQICSRSGRSVSRYSIGLPLTTPTQTPLCATRLVRCASGSSSSTTKKAGTPAFASLSRRARTFPYFCGRHDRLEGPGSWAQGTKRKHYPSSDGPCGSCNGNSGIQNDVKAGIGSSSSPGVMAARAHRGPASHTAQRYSGAAAGAALAVNARVRRGILLDASIC